MNELPSQEYLNECIAYDSNTGECFWKTRDITHFKSESSYKMWNTRFSGKQITGVDKTGRIRLNLDNKEYALHKLIFKMHFGIDPSKYLRHKDNDVTNNRIENLYEDDVMFTGGNRKTPIHNTSGLTGASYKANGKIWESEITFKNKRYYLGRFDTAEAAHAAYVEASNQLKDGTYDKV
jgi:hypothetical protein